VGFRVPLDFLFQRCLISTLQWETTNRGFGSCERNDGVAPKLFGSSGRSAHGTGHEMRIHRFGGKACFVEAN
jgi:hypothetical protein